MERFEEHDIEKSLLLEYACRYKMYDLVKKLVAGKNLLEMACPRMVALTATVASIIDNLEVKEHVDKVVAILWEIYDVVPKIVPFEKFGNLIIDVLIYCKISMAIDMNDSTKLNELLDEIQAIFRIPKSVRHLSEENRVWLSTKFKAVSEKLVVLAKHEERHHHWNDLLSSSPWGNIKNRIDQYMDKVNLEIGPPFVELFSYIDTKQKHRKEEHQVERSGIATPVAVDDLIKRAKKAASILNRYHRPEPDLEVEHQQQSDSETSFQSDEIELNILEQIMNIMNNFSHEEIEDLGEETCCGYRQESVAEPTDMPGTVEQGNDFSPMLFDSEPDESYSVINQKRLEKETSTPKKQSSATTRASSPLFSDISQDSVMFDAIKINESVTQCIIALDNQTDGPSTESAENSPSLDTTNNKIEVNEASLGDEPTAMDQQKMEMNYLKVDDITSSKATAIGIPITSGQTKDTEGIAKISIERKASEDEVDNTVIDREAILNIRPNAKAQTDSQLEKGSRNPVRISAKTNLYSDDSEIFEDISCPNYCTNGIPTENIECPMAIDITDKGTEVGNAIRKESRDITSNNNNRVTEIRNVNKPVHIDAISNDDAIPSGIEAVTKILPSSDQNHDQENNPSTGNSNKPVLVSVKAVENEAVHILREKTINNDVIVPNTTEAVNTDDQNNGLLSENYNINGNRTVKELPRENDGDNAAMEPQDKELLDIVSKKAVIKGVSGSKDGLEDSADTSMHTNFINASKEVTRKTTSVNDQTQSEVIGEISSLPKIDNAQDVAKQISSNVLLTAGQNNRNFQNDILPARSNDYPMLSELTKNKVAATISPLGQPADSGDRLLNGGKNNLLGQNNCTGIQTIHSNDDVNPQDGFTKANSTTNIHKTGNVPPNLSTTRANFQPVTIIYINRQPVTKDDSTTTTRISPIVVTLNPKNNYKFCDNSQTSYSNQAPGNQVNKNQQEFTIFTSDGQQFELLYTVEGVSTSSLPTSKNTSLTKQPARLNEDNSSSLHSLTSEKLPTALPGEAGTHEFSKVTSRVAHCSSESKGLSKKLNTNEKASEKRRTFNTSASRIHNFDQKSYCTCDTSQASFTNQPDIKNRRDCSFESSVGQSCDHLETAESSVQQVGDALDSRRPSSFKDDWKNNTSLVKKLKQAVSAEKKRKLQEGGLQNDSKRMKADTALQSKTDQQQLIPESTQETISARRRTEKTNTSFTRIKPCYPLSQGFSSQADESPTTVGSPILTWVHDHSYARSPSISELQRPTSAASTQENRWPSTDESSEELRGNSCVVDERQNCTNETFVVIKQENDPRPGLNPSAPITDESSSNKNSSKRLVSAKREKLPDNSEQLNSYHERLCKCEVSRLRIQYDSVSTDYSLSEDSDIEQTSSEKLSAEVQCSEVSAFEVPNSNMTNSRSSRSANSSDSDEIPLAWVRERLCKCEVSASSAQLQNLSNNGRRKRKRSASFQSSHSSGSFFAKGNHGNKRLRIQNDSVSTDYSLSEDSDIEQTSSEELSAAVQCSEVSAFEVPNSNTRSSCSANSSDSDEIPLAWVGLRRRSKDRTTKGREILRRRIENGKVQNLLRKCNLRAVVRLVKLEIVELLF